MADAYIGEIRIFAGNFAPRGWALCDGTLLPISQNPALYSILGMIYGGDGQTTFRLPDLRGRAPMHFGQGSGLTERTIGEQVGEGEVTLGVYQMPNHTHIAQGSSTFVGGIDNPTNAIWGSEPANTGSKPYVNFSNTSAMNPLALQPQGSNQAHNNRQPFLAMNFIICINDGEYPARP
ncbi:tail fiber protein [Metasolibacillus meyeri]|uniref:Tail fiber protein n=1 Tax=Metasolibacillus meyeri TaxID=1071052 RepID=A0AAW9NUJ1_9BACL|nr:tail fiber protein [Metasolibacillus meyeri]MEC1179519.1 tail fiber protein [Metasolibacillus meyeri]